MDFSREEEQQVVKRLLAIGSQKSFQRGDLIYSEGDSPTHLYYIEKGLVGLIKLSPTGNESLLRIFKADQFFGHRTLFSGETYHASAKCLEPTNMILVEKQKVIELFDENPKSYFFLARALAKELRRAENRSVLVSEAHILERVASALLLFKKLYPEHMWTRTEIANYVASRTPTVIKALAELEKEGAIKQDRRYLEIVDESALLGFLSETGTDYL